jgi:hypothetical protein
VTIIGDDSPKPLLDPLISTKFGVDTIVYPVTGAPPLLVGGVKLTVTDA